MGCPAVPEQVLGAMKRRILTIDTIWKTWTSTEIMKAIWKSEEMDVDVFSLTKK